MHRRGLSGLILLSPLAAQEPARTVKFTKPRVPDALFTPGHTALLEPECARIATFLARYAARHCSAGVLRGEPETVARGRLLLTVSLHLQPLNPSAVHCSTRWLDGQEPALAPEEENLRVFTDFLLAAAARQPAKPAPGQEMLARVLNRLAADFDPRNEAAVLASELQDRDGRTPPFRALLEGTVKLPAP
jgi:hypothetical protein